MKVTIGMTGTPLTTPDFSMLKAALVAAQAGTPTARASGPKAKPIDQRAALHSLFTAGETPGPSTDAPEGDAADALGHRFSREGPAEDPAP